MTRKTPSPWLAGIGAAMVIAGGILLIAAQLPVTAWETVFLLVLINIKPVALTMILAGATMVFFTAIGLSAWSAENRIAPLPPPPPPDWLGPQTTENFNAYLAMCAKWNEEFDEKFFIPPHTERYKARAQAEIALQNLKKRVRHGG